MFYKTLIFNLGFAPAQNNVAVHTLCILGSLCMYNPPYPVPPLFRAVLGYDSGRGVQPLKPP